MSALSSLARSSVRAHRGGFAGTFLVLALAAALLAATGVLMESGLRAGTDAGLLTALAGSFAGTTILVVVLVVASTVTLAMRQRRRDLALLRAIGATRAQVRRLVGTEVALVTAVAAPLGALPGLALAHLVVPLLVSAGVVPAGFDLSLSPAPVLSATLLLLAVALVAGRLAARETLRTPPTSAVRESAVEARGIGPVRRVLAIGTAACGIAAAGSPLVVPGTIGGATAATSALLLVGAAALAGPLLVTWVLDRTTSLQRLAPGAAGRLALANTRGFSHRLTTVVVPLAVALAVGTVQSSVDRAVVTAAADQLRAGIHADLVVTGPQGLDSVAAVPGVESTTSLASVTAQVRTDDEEVPGLEALSWEPIGLRVLPDEPGAEAAYNPDVVRGSLGDLSQAETVAISSDAAFETGKDIGDVVAIRLGDGQDTEAAVVAVYDRGLGFGGYLVGAATPREHGVDAPVDTVLVSTDDPSAVARDLRADGLTAVDVQTYVGDATSTGAQEQHLSLVLLLLLLGFVGLSAGNALVMTTVGRRNELALLSRTGATHRQLVVMAAVESVITAAAAWAIGTLAVVPAVFGVSYGVLGTVVPTIDLTTYAALSAAVLGISVLTIVPTVAVRLRSMRT